MLNISDNSISQFLDRSRYNSLGFFRQASPPARRRWLISAFFLLLIALSFLPWTQNIRAPGYVTSLRPEQRPQTIPALIAGRIEKWYVTEGQRVSQGDTIVRISEIKEDYIDPKLLDRTQQQIMAKESSVSSYMEKVKALDQQIDALNDNLQLQLEQARNKVKQAQLKVRADSIDLVAARLNERIAGQQFERMDELYQEGLKSKTEMEQRLLKLQETQAKTISLESKLISSRNEVINARVELNSLEAEYRDKVSKAESEKFASMSNMFEAESELSKLQNRYSSYALRSGFYYITAPQDGYITKARASGIGELLKEGESLVTIMPSDYQLAVEMYIRPIDLPLMDRGQEILIQFDGWPAIVFSGWPGVSTGTYKGKVVAIDNFASDNGQFRMLVAPIDSAAPWPEQIRVGAGAKTFALLKEVPIWYELWRQINGFPPDYYRDEKKSDQKAIKEEKE